MSFLIARTAAAETTGPPPGTEKMNSEPCACVLQEQTVLSHCPILYSVSYITMRTCRGVETHVTSCCSARSSSADYVHVHNYVAIY